MTCNPSESVLPTPNPPRKYRDCSHGEMIADGAVHAAALVAGVIGFSVLFQKVALRGATSDGVAMAIYAVGFFLLFGFSCAYNMTPPSPAKWLLRRFDHASIYLMIGGTYTALLSQVYLAFWTIALSATVWTGALGGASLKLFLPGRFDRASLGVYLGARLVGADRSQAARLRPACPDAGVRRHGRRALFDRRRLPSVAEPQVSERHLALLRHRRRRLPFRRRVPGGRALNADAGCRRPLS